MEAAAGQRFGRYVVESQIGVGGMGVVYAALDTRLNRTVALKVISKHLADRPEFTERFQREADTLARLDSPHVVTVFDHGEQDGVPFLAAQYVRGGDLGRLLKQRGPMPPLPAVQLCAQIAEGLADAHRAGVIHRDIKPSNVLLRDPDADRLHAYLCDFGIAQSEDTESMTHAGAVVGTWAYLAPERSAGEPATRASDLYSLGCLLWVCLTGNAPYTGTDVSVAMSHVNAPVRQLAGTDELSVYLNGVLARCMAKDPAQRYTSAEEVQAALEAAPGATVALTPTPMAAPPAPLVQPPTMLPGQTPGALSAAATTVAASRSAGAQGGPDAAGVVVPAIPSVPDLFSGPPAGPASSPYAGGGPRRGLVVAAAVVAVLLVVGLVVWLTGRGGDEPEPAGGGDPAPSGSPTEPGPSDPEGDVGYPGAPAPTEGVPEGTAVAGDLDGDRLGDALALLVDAGRRSTRYTVATYSSDGSAFDVARTRVDEFHEPVLGDWTGDGDLGVLELVVDARGLRLESNDPDVPGMRYPGLPLVASQNFVDTTAGDVDGDGDLDLVLSGQTATRTLTVWVMRGDGAGSFGAPEQWWQLKGGHIQTTGLSAGDFDHDGNTDLLLNEPSGSVSFFDGSATYTGPRQVQLLRSTGSAFERSGAVAEDPVLADGATLVTSLRGDGVPLVVVLNQSSASPAAITVHELGPDGLTELPQYRTNVSLGVGTARGTTADVDGDGLRDLVLLTREAADRFGPVQVLRSTGDGFEAPEQFAPAPPCRSAECYAVFAKSY